MVCIQLKHVSSMGMALLLMGLAVPGSPAGHDIDPDRGEIVVHTDRSGLFGFAGHRHRIEAGAYSGTIAFDPRWIDHTMVRLIIPTADLRVADDQDSSTVAKVEHNMRTSVLEIDTHPTITFVSTGVSLAGEATASNDAPGARELSVIGELTLHGQTRSIAFTAYVAVEGGDVHVVGDVKIKQTDFGIDPVSAGLGTVKVKDEVTIAFDVWATPTSDPPTEE